MSVITSTLSSFKSIFIASSSLSNTSGQWVLLKVFSSSSSCSSVNIVLCRLFRFCPARAKSAAVINPGNGLYAAAVIRINYIISSGKRNELQFLIIWKEFPTSIFKNFITIENGIIRFKKYVCKIIFFSNYMKASSPVFVKKKPYRITGSYKIAHLNIDERLILKSKSYMNMQIIQINKPKSLGVISLFVSFSYR